jgi:hypothetical protein
MASDTQARLFRTDVIEVVAAGIIKGLREVVD